MRTPQMLALVAAAADAWSRFRGPNGSGVAAGDGYPATLDPEKNAAWRSPARPGKSSPVLTDSRIFTTGVDGDKLYTQCFERASGRLLWERWVERERVADMNQLNEAASISPVTDGENVYVFFRDLGVISYGAEGELRWRTPLGPFANSMGHSSSPVLAGGRLIVQADQKGGSYVAALDLANGEIVWTIPREEGEGWATPIVYRDEQIVTTSRGWLGSHRAADGKRIWGLQELSPAIVASPVTVGDTVYTFGYGNEPTSNFAGSFDNRDKDGDGTLTPAEVGESAFMAGIAKYEGDKDGLLTREEYLIAANATIAPSRLFAFRFGETGLPRELWRYERSFVGVIPSPLIYEGVVYLIKNGGILETLDAENGEVLTRGRLRDAIGGYSASPVAGGGLVYLASEDGKVTTLEAGRQWKVAAANDLGESIFATPALSGGEVFVRTQATLFCFRGATK